MKTAIFIALIGALACATSAAGPLALPPAPQAEFTQNIGATLPLQQRFVDDDGSRLSLQQAFAGRSSLLLFGYYRCTMLCGVVGAGVLEALAHAHLADGVVRVVEVGIDPRETPSDAAEKKADYARRFGTLAEHVHLLTGAAPAIDAVAATAGFHYSYDPVQAQYIHPAGFIIVTPQGRISRYFLGVRFDPHELKQAIDQAGSERIGSVLQRLLLLCSHYDPASGRHSTAVMTIVRVVCIGICVFLSAWIWRRRRARRSDA